MNTFTCSKCGEDWPENYCPKCAQTIDKSQTPKPLEQTNAPPSATLFPDSDEEKADFLQRLKTATPKAWVTPLLIGINVAVFLVLSVDSGTILGFLPLTLIKWGGNFGPLTVNCHQWWRLLTCCFLHGGIMHLLFNMYALLLAGKLTEQLFGNWYFLLIYLGCGLAASLTSLWFNPAFVSVGASGAIFGVYGALLGYMKREGGGLPHCVAAPVANSCWVFIGWNVVYGLLNALNHAADQIVSSLNNAHSNSTIIDIGAHAGGLLAGLIFGFLGARHLEITQRRSSTPGRALALSGGICLIVGLLVIPVLKSNGADIGRAKLLGEMYYRGEGVSKKPAASASWLKLAAEQGDLSSQLVLGLMYYKGDGVPKDVSSAVQWFAKAGEQGDVNAQKTLAGIYLQGEGVPTNTAEGVKWLIMAGNHGDIEVQKILAAAYFKGDGVEKSVTEAVNWARKAGNQGDVDYEKMLAAMYDTGKGVDRSKPEAANWYRQAANQGDANSQKALGLMYANGDGIEKNPIEALKWLALCGDNSIEVSKLRQDLETGMSADQIQTANRLVKKFLQVLGKRQTHQ
jgi:TPR repeat protein/membrane associated rhomboid family serine protease